MPYIITTASKYRRDHSLDCWPLPRSGSAPDQCDCSFMDVRTRTAVATLDEAREAAHQTAGGSGPWVKVRPFVWDAKGMPESGGTVGPLPDGTVIEVRQVEWADLPPVAEARKRYPHGPARDAVLRDFNAR